MRAALAGMKKNALFELHFSLGVAIRNGYGLHDPESPLSLSAREELGYLGMDPDHVSTVIIDRAWRLIRSGNP